MNNILQNSRVVVVKDLPEYARVPPFHPSEAYSEWRDAIISPQDNPAYRAVRQLLCGLDLDRRNFGAAQWNPLGEWIHPGDFVILKPNLVHHQNQGEKDYGITDTDCLVTHGSVIRAVLDYVSKAMNGRGKIIIGDSPIQGTDWNKLLALVGLNEIRDYYAKRFPEIDLQFKDYRLGKAVVRSGQVVERVVDEQARHEYVEVDLQSESQLIPLMQRGAYYFGVAQYPRRRMRCAHTLETNRYLIHRDFFEAQAVINLPKMKLHMKAGVTGAMKNLVGIVGHKDYLPHFRFSSPKNGGDEYPDGDWLWDLIWFFVHQDWDLDRGWRKFAYSTLARICRFVYRLAGNSKEWITTGGGSWSGNDTLWRTVLDVNRAFFYYDPVQRRIDRAINERRVYLAILDGLIGGAKQSPLAPSPVPCGVMMASCNPLALDTVMAAWMGLDIPRIKQLESGFALASLPLVQFSADEIIISGNSPVTSLREIYQQEAFTRFEPSIGFKGQIEHMAS